MGASPEALKSGGNQPHGALFEFLRNDIFDVRNFFDADKSKLRRNQCHLASVRNPSLSSHYRRS